MADEILSRLREAITKFDRARSKQLTAQAIERGIDPLQIIEKVLRPSLNQVGKDFEDSKIFLPELVAVGDIAVEVGAILEKAIAGRKETPSAGSIAIGTVKGDIHSIGKNIVVVMMKAFGFKVIDLGVDVSPDEFTRLAPQVDALALSGLLTLATRSIRETIKAVSSTLPGKIMIAGGAAMNPELAKELGILYGADAASGVRIIRQALEVKD